VPLAVNSASSPSASAWIVIVVVDFVASTIWLATVRFQMSS